MSSPKVYTYHCICSHLILATTRNLDSLPRRRPPGLDSAYIVPLPPPPKTANSDSEASSDESDNDEPRKEKKANIDAAPAGEGGDKMEVDAKPPAEATGTGAGVYGDAAKEGAMERDGVEDDGDDGKDYTLLLSSVRDRKPCIIRRDDGFERRLLWRCGRCRLIFGYQIDDDEEEENKAEEEQGGEGGEGAAAKKKKRKEKKGYVYVLPGSVVPADKMGTLEEKDLQLVND